jgi:ABC-type nitrate/sulfonate/bicarbonate transport system substrate-binding protein
MVRRRLIGAAIVAAIAVGIAVPAIATASPRPAATPQSKVLVSSKECATNRAAGPINFVSPFNFDASAGIIDVFAAQSLGYFAAECLNVTFTTNSNTATALVSSGVGTISGEGSAADDLYQVAGGLHLTAIATYGDTSDYALLTAPGISSPKALEGKTVAYHTIFPVILHELLQRAGVNLSKVNFVNDTTYNPTLLDNGTYQGLQAYQSNEPLELTADHLSYHEYTPADYKISGTFNVQVVNTTFLKKHPSTVADFLRAELHAFDYCSTHEPGCVSLEGQAAKAAGVSFDAAHALAEWKIEVNLALHHHLTGQGIGVESTKEWQPEAKMLTSQHVVKAVPKLATAEDTALAASLYKGTKLIWPGP